MTMFLTIALAAVAIVVAVLVVVTIHRRREQDLRDAARLEVRLAALRETFSHKVP